MKIDEQIKNLKKLKLPADEFVVVSSGALAIRGIRDARDIDVIPTEKLWNEMSERYKVELNKSGIEEIVLPDDIEILNPRDSLFGNSKIIPFKELFDEADIFEGIKFINLQHLKKIKSEFGREKDFEDIKLIDQYLQNHGNF